MLGEHGPNGLVSTDLDVRLDKGKPHCSLALDGLSRALLEAVKVGTFEAAKHCGNDWRPVLNGHQRYADALWRHLPEEEQGHLSDPDFAFLHVVHIRWNALTRLELMLQSNNHESP